MDYFIEIQGYNRSYFSVDQLPCSNGKQLQTKHGTGLLGPTISIACQEIFRLLQPHSQQIEIRAKFLSSEERTDFKTTLTKELSDKFPNISLNLDTP